MNREDKGCVLLADRHSRLSEGVRGLLETTFRAVVMVADETSLFESLSRLEVKLAVVDLSVTRSEGLQMVRHLRGQYPTLKLIVTSVHDEPSVTDSALEAGADGFVLKRTIAADLLPAIDAVLLGKTFTSPGASRQC